MFVPVLQNTFHLNLIQGLKLLRSVFLLTVFAHKYVKFQKIFIKVQFISGMHKR